MTSEASSQEAVQCPLGLLKRLLSGPSRCENPSHSETHTGARHVIERALGHPLPLFEVSHCSRFLSCGPDIVELKQDGSLLPDGVPGENKEEGEGFTPSAGGFLHSSGNQGRVWCFIVDAAKTGA